MLKMVRRALVRLLFNLLMDRTSSAQGAANGKGPWHIIVGWNDPRSSIVPASVLVIENPYGVRQHIAMSPAQLEMHGEHVTHAAADLRRQFGYDQAPEYDARTIFTRS